MVAGILDAKLERGDIVLALGGGVIGDLAGFAASIARRGMDFVQIPTSLLAQVDSSVGGKTGINAPQGKNLVGAFHQPKLVLADLGALETLPPREFAAGYAEVVKYGLIDDEAFFFWLEENRGEIFAGDAALRGEMVARCCEAKTRFVLADEKETGVRALLNLGHTFGHALEKATGYSDRLLHGEGVAIGMVLAHGFSAKLGLAPSQDTGRIAAHLKSRRPADARSPKSPATCRRHRVADGRDRAGQEGRARRADLHPDPRHRQGVHRDATSMRRRLPRTSTRCVRRSYGATVITTRRLSLNAGPNWSVSPAPTAVAVAYFSPFSRR